MKLSPLSLGTLHFIGIGGIGMSGLAEILHNLGQPVQGSDLSLNANSQRLEKMGIPVFFPQQGTNLDNADVAVISSAIKASNPEYKAAIEKGIPIIHRSDLLAQLLRLKWSVAVAGSHGKTTTTSLVAHLFETASLSPTVVNGGVINAYGSNARLGKGDWIVAEADESDGSFTKYFPTVGIVTNLDPEHMDHYCSFDDLKAAFLTFLNNIPFYGFALLGIDHPEVAALGQKLSNRQAITYGFVDGAQIQGQNVRFEDNSMRFDVAVRLPHCSITKLNNLRLNMLGKHNVQNSLAIIGLALKIGLDEEIIRQALNSFEGVKRRLTHIGTLKGAYFYDDYAHHPKEILAILETLALLKEKHPDKKIHVIFQPHRYTRLSYLFEGFASAFDLADATYILPVYTAGEAPIEGINHATLTAAIQARAKPALSKNTIEAHESVQSLEATLVQSLKPGDVVVFMGAGSITYMAADFIERHKNFAS